MAVELQRWRFTVDDYYRMAQAGIFNEDDRVELLDGAIIEMPPIGPLHAGDVDGAAQIFFEAFRDVAQVRVQNPVRLNQYSEPQPDLALLQPRADFYRTRHPGPTDVYLLVEVADTSAEIDRRVKLPLYARAGVPEVWLLNLNLDAILVHRDPSPEGYRTVQTLRRGERLAPLAFPERELAVNDLLG